MGHRSWNRLFGEHRLQRVASGPGLELPAHPSTRRYPRRGDGSSSRQRRQRKDHRCAPVDHRQENDQIQHGFGPPAMSCSSETDSEDQIVVTSGLGTAIGVAGRHPQGPIWSCSHAPNPTVVLREIGSRLARGSTPEWHGEKALPTQRTDEGGGDRNRQTGGRTATGRRPRQLRCLQSGFVRASFHTRPPVVLALDDEVELIRRLLAELGSPQPALGVERQTLDVAMPIAPDPIAVRIAGGGPTVGANPQDLAQYGVLVLRSRGISSITGGDEQHALWVEQQPTAVMANAGWDACQDRFGSPQATAPQTAADDTIVAS